MAFGNPLLSRVAVELRRGRPQLPADRTYTVRSEFVGGARLVRIWWATGGCSQDAAGACTTCNYGRAIALEPEEMARAVTEAVRDVRVVPGDVLLVSPSGSMFDEREVPASARRLILEALASTPASQIICESRPEYVTPTAMAEYAAVMAGKRPTIEMGLESADPWVLRWCINKRLDLASAIRASTVAHLYGIEVTMNVLLGSPFLSAKEAVEDAVATVVWCRSTGVDLCVLFPVHVIDFTAAAWLWRHGLYEPPSLWSLVEVLDRCGARGLGDLTISWHRDYDSGSPEMATRGGAVLASPTSCPECIGEVLDALSLFRGNRDGQVVKQLAGHPCGCHRAWRAHSATSVSTRTLRAAACYERLGRGLLGDQWWLDHGWHALEGLVADGVAASRFAAR